MVRKPDWWVAIFTAALFVATAGLWLFTALMWRTTQRALRDGQKTVAAAQETAEAAVRSADIAERALLESDRPYLYVQLGGHSLGVGEQPVYVQAHIFNIGNRAAILNQISAQLVAEDLVLANYVADHRQVLSGETPLVFSAAGPPLLETVRNQLRSGKSAAEFVINISYQNPQGASWLYRGSSAYRAPGFSVGEQREGFELTRWFDLRAEAAEKTITLNPSAA